MPSSVSVALFATLAAPSTAVAFYFHSHCNSYPEAKKRGPKPGQLLRVKEEAKVCSVASAPPRLHFVIFIEH